MFIHAAEEPENGLGRGQDVERRRDRRAGVEVRNPKLRSSKLPLGVSFFRNDLYNNKNKFQLISKDFALFHGKLFRRVQIFFS